MLNPSSRRRRLHTGPTEATATESESRLARSDASFPAAAAISTRLPTCGWLVNAHCRDLPRLQPVDHSQHRSYVVGHPPSVEGSLPHVRAPFPKRPEQQVVGAAVSLYRHLPSGEADVLERLDHIFGSEGLGRHQVDAYFVAPQHRRRLGAAGEDGHAVEGGQNFGQPTPGVRRLEQRAGTGAGLEYRDFDTAGAEVVD